MTDPDALPPLVLDENGIWRDPMPLEQMTPRQRARYVRLLREDAGFAPNKVEMRRAREELEAFLDEVLHPEGREPPKYPDSLG